MKDVEKNNRGKYEHACKHLHGVTKATRNIRRKGQLAPGLDSTPRPTFLSPFYRRSLIFSRKECYALIIQVFRLLH
jgi:hypothetical protein